LTNRRLCYRKHAAHALAEHVKVAFGAGAGLNARQFGVMVKLGMTPLAAIQSATINAADLLGSSGKVGALEPAHYADLIAVEGNPVARVRLLENVKFVIKGGHVYRDEAHGADIETLGRCRRSAILDAYPVYSVYRSSC
jgi:imidazolonepropionase-like amidohydrolase